MLGVVLGILLISFGSLFIVFGIRDEYAHRGYVKKAEVVAAFKDTDWGIQRFFNEGTPVLDSKHRDSFYASVEIDKAIKRLNKVLAQ